MYPLRRLLFQLDSERVHNGTIALLSRLAESPPLVAWLAQQFRVDDPRLQMEAGGLKVANPVGLAAGFDKDARALPALAALGFGFVEAGTLTPRPQPGNPRPRLFRLPEDEAIINRMGFNNAGIAAAAERLRRQGPLPVPLGINLGKNKDTPNDAAVEDYLQGMETLYPFAGYFVVNVSSPNTPGLRELQQAQRLNALLATLQERNHALAQARGSRVVPLWVKLAPDLDDDALEAIVRAVEANGCAGIIATNTTVTRPDLRSPLAGEAGGLSGRPLRALSTRVIAAVFQLTRGSLPIIGVGGIMSGNDAIEKIAAGASLLQVYSGLVYAGPGLVRDINRSLLAWLEREKATSLKPLVGRDAGLFARSTHATMPT